MANAAQQFTLSSGSIMRPVRSALGSAQIRYFQESTAASTALIRRGDVVQFDPLVATASMRIRRDLIASTTPSTGILGVAGETSTSDGGTTGLSTSGILETHRRMIQVYLADPAHTEFQVWTDTAAASTWLNRTFALKRESTLNIWLLDNNNSTVADHRVRVTDLPYPDSTNAPVYVRFMSVRDQLDSTASTRTGLLALGQ